jgi:pimeloyl-ACP methyl ester carboxylesterase
MIDSRELGMTLSAIQSRATEPHRKDFQSMPHFSSDGVEIAYLDEGNGDPILLIHGFASSAQVNWVDTGWVRDLVRSGRRVIAIDNRGHGHSEKLHDPSRYGGPVMAEDARRLLDHLMIERADVMGYSMGARITAFLALAHPGRVRSAVFAGLGGNMVRPMAGTGPIAAALEAPSIDDVSNSTARTFRAFAEQTKSDLKAMAACIRSSRDPLTPEALATLTCPVLVAVGSDDVIGGKAEVLAKLIPGAEAFVIEGRDHMKAVGDRSYKDAVIAFLARRP